MCLFFFQPYKFLLVHVLPEILLYLLLSFSFFFNWWIFCVFKSQRNCHRRDSKHEFKRSVYSICMLLIIVSEFHSREHVWPVFQVIHAKYWNVCFDFLIYLFHCLDDMLWLTKILSWVISKVPRMILQQIKVLNLKWSCPWVQIIHKHYWVRVLHIDWLSKFCCMVQESPPFVRPWSTTAKLNCIPQK